VRGFCLDALTVVLGPERTRHLAGGSYDLTNRIDHELGLLPVDEVAAVRIGRALGVEKRGELILSRQPRRACRLRISAREKLAYPALICGEHDSGDLAHRWGGAGAGAL
jgi:hypothetical protein